MDSGSSEQLVSGSDDGSVIIHNVDTGARIHSITFRSPVMSLKWHPVESAKMLAAEKSGLMHLFNMVTFNPILSLDCGQGPLLSADWSLSNRYLKT